MAKMHRVVVEVEDDAYDDFVEAVVFLADIVEEEEFEDD